MNIESQQPLLCGADADAGGAGDLARGELEGWIGFDPEVAAEGEVPAVLLAVDGEGFAEACGAAAEVAGFHE